MILPLLPSQTPRSTAMAMSSVPKLDVLRARVQSAHPVRSPQDTRGQRHRRSGDRQQDCRGNSDERDECVHDALGDRAGARSPAAHILFVLQEQTEYRLALAVLLVRRVSEHPPGISTIHHRRRHQATLVALRLLVVHRLHPEHLGLERQLRRQQAGL